MYHGRNGYMGKGEHEKVKPIELGGKWGDGSKRQCSSTTTIRPIGVACGRTKYGPPRVPLQCRRGYT